MFVWNFLDIQITKKRKIFNTKLRSSTITKFRSYYISALNTGLSNIVLHAKTFSWVLFRKRKMIFY